MQRSLTATMRRTARRTVTWRPKSVGRETMRIDQLISPLRYDVLVRAQFFVQLGAVEPATRRDPAALVELARGNAYATWFRWVAMARFRPYLLDRPEALEAQFRERVVSAVALWESFRHQGFDVAHPVTLRAARGPLPTDSGIVVDRRVHVGDGGHRLALLLADGRPLEPQMYRVDPRPIRTLPDNTAILVPRLGVGASDYTAFVSPGYSDRVHSDPASLVQEVRDCAPLKADELEKVLRTHLDAVEFPS